MSQRHHELTVVLQHLELELQRLNCWAAQKPSPEALASTAPFAVDTMTFPEWLQFIFIPRLAVMIEYQTPLPQASGIAPMAEEYFKLLSLDSTILIRHIQQIDSLLSSKSTFVGN